jgi:hypothetical protein
MAMNYLVQIALLLTLHWHPFWPMDVVQPLSWIDSHFVGGIVRSSYMVPRTLNLLWPRIFLVWHCSAGQVPHATWSRHPTRLLLPWVWCYWQVSTVASSWIGHNWSLKYEVYSILDMTGHTILKLCLKRLKSLGGHTSRIPKLLSNIVDIVR